MSRSEHNSEVSLATTEFLHRQGSQLCRICGTLLCQRPDHQLKLLRLSQQRGPVNKKRSFSDLLNSSFSSSYSFNPLFLAIDYVCDKLKFPIDTGVLGCRKDLAFALHKLIAYDVAGNVPFKDSSRSPGSIEGVAAEWLVASSVDEIACVSTLNIWMLTQWTRTQEAILGVYSTRLTSLLMEQLRERVANRQLPGYGTVFAASNHLNTHLLYHYEANERNQTIINGVEALVNAHGGFQKLIKDSHPGIFQSLLWNDVLYCIYTGARPRFILSEAPPCPSSLVLERASVHQIPSLYWRCCSPDLMETARRLRLFLCFRPDSQLRDLTKGEYDYLITLERVTIVQILQQGARYHETGTMDECIILALTLFRVSVICIWEQLVWTRRRATQRLESALSKVSFDEWKRTDAVEALVWICYVILGQKEACYQETFIVGTLVDALKMLYGTEMRSWPTGWEKDFSAKHQPLIWHSDYDEKVSVVKELILKHGGNEKQID